MINHLRMGIKKKRIRVFCDIVTFSAREKNFHFFAAPQNIVSLHFFLEAIARSTSGCLQRGTSHLRVVGCWTLRMKPVKFKLRANADATTTQQCWELLSNNIASFAGGLMFTGKSWKLMLKTLGGWKEKRRVFFSRPSYYLRPVHRWNYLLLYVRGMTSVSKNFCLSLNIFFKGGYLIDVYLRDAHLSSKTQKRMPTNSWPNRI